MNYKSIIKLLLSIGLCQTAGLIGSIFTNPVIPTWYASLVKPSFNPPNWVFAPVWLILYTLMGISLYLVWQKGIKKNNVKALVILFLIHLIFNALWSILFFGLQNPLAGLLNIIIIWSLIIILIIRFYKIQKLSAYLLVPYFLWVTFASILNFSLWWLNK